MGEVEKRYIALRRIGTPAEIARSVLPNALKAEIGVTANARAWRHFLRLRLSPKAHPQMREIARLLCVELRQWFPAAFEEFSDPLPGV
jgi:thymidylate synthase (FAD)